MLEKLDPRPAAIEIVEILHKNKIPIAFIQSVFNLVVEEINQHTIPYNPNLEKIYDFPTSETISKATAPNG